VTWFRFCGEDSLSTLQRSDYYALLDVVRGLRTEKNRTENLR